MKVKRMVKRLFAVASGATMLGATAMGALAADLSSYPDMFVTDGSFDGFFVVGESAASVDNLAMTDIATGMKTKTGASTSTTVEGDAWLVASSGNFLELRESINAIESYINDGHLGALADGEVSNAKGTAKYEQFLYFDQNTVPDFASFQEDDSDKIGYFYKVSNGKSIARYYLDFTDTLDSDIDSSNNYDDIEDKQIQILGRLYSIVTATNESTGAKLTLMGGAASDTLLEGETKTYTVGAKEYTVEVAYVDATNVQFSVNGELTTKLADGETDVLSDGTNLGVREINYQAYAGGIHSASFFLGADKLTLENGQSLKVNEETINEAAVAITTTETTGDIAIEDISVNMTADDDFYVGADQTLSQNPEMDEPAVLFTQNWDLKLAEVAIAESKEAISLTFSEGDDQADLSVPFYDGVVSISLVFDNSSSADTLVPGEDDDSAFVFVGYRNVTIGDEDYFILNTADATDATTDAKSYFLQYKGADDSAETSPKARVKNVATGEVYERSLTNGTTTVSFDLKLGGVTFTLSNASSVGTDDWLLNYTSGGNTNVVQRDGQGYNATQTFRTKDNNEVTFKGLALGANNTAPLFTDDFEVWVYVDDTDKFDDAGDASVLVMNVSLSGSGTAQDLGTTTQTTNSSLVSDPSDTDIQYSSSVYGEKLTITAPTSGPSKYELSIPSSQAQVKLYVTSGSTTTAASAAGGS